MRMIVSSAHIAILSGSLVASYSNETEEATNKLVNQVAKNVDLAYSSHSFFRLQQSLRTLSSPSKGEECNPDIGILGCSHPQQVCIQDISSSRGGRCFTNARMLHEHPNWPMFHHRRWMNHRANVKLKQQSPRLLQSVSITCPVNCPQNFCDCAQLYDEVKYCATSFYSLCVDSIVAECVPGRFLPFYEETYCPLAGCLLSERTYQECSCDYYRDYCKLYYQYENSADACAIAACCEAKSVEDKLECIPERMPSAMPSGSPTMSLMPTGYPTVSFFS